MLLVSAVEASPHQAEESRLSSAPALVGCEADHASTIRLSTPGGLMLCQVHSDTIDVPAQLQQQNHALLVPQTPPVFDFTEISAVSTSFL